MTKQSKRSARMDPNSVPILDTSNGGRRQVRVFLAPRTKKQQTRSNVSGPKSFVMDTSDYRVVREVITKLCARPYCIGKEIQKIAELEEGRIRKLDLRGEDYESSLLCSIGSLERLRELLVEANKPYHLRKRTKLKGIPPTIWQLKNLKHLSLVDTDLSKLPEDIGDLIGLEILSLQGSSITSLPSSVGKLGNLRCLNLSFNRKLKTLPQEVGRLHNLEILDLDHAEELSVLPEGIGALPSVVVLNLRGSGIMTLPDSISYWKALKRLCIDQTGLLFFEKTETFLFWLVHRCPSLVYLGTDIEGRMPRVALALACNSPCVQKLWPRMLSSVSRMMPSVNILKPDTIYQRLLEGRESFLIHLICRSQIEIPSQLAQL